MPLNSEEYCGSNQSIMMLREQWMSWIPDQGKEAMAKEQNLLKYTVLMNRERKVAGGDDQIVSREERAGEMYRMYSTLTHLDTREQFLLIGTVVTAGLVSFPVPMAQGNQAPFVVSVAVLECTVSVQSMSLHWKMAESNSSFSSACHSNNGPPPPTLLASVTRIISPCAPGMPKHFAIATLCLSSSNACCS